MHNITTILKTILPLALVFLFLKNGIAQCPDNATSSAASSDVFVDTGVLIPPNPGPLPDPVYVAIFCENSFTAAESPIDITYEDPDTGMDVTTSISKTTSGKIGNNCAVKYGHIPDNATNPFTLFFPSTMESCSYAASGALPVELIDFDIRTVEQQVYLNWSTAAELNNSHFEILRSKDAKDWEVIATISGAGTTNLPINYQFIDRSPLEGDAYYALSQTDFDGTTEMLGVHFINIAANELTVKLFPNPTSHDLNLQVSEAAKFPLAVSIFNATGKQITIFQIEDNYQTLDVSTFDNGFYYLQINDGRRITTERFLKQ